MAAPQGDTTAVVATREFWTWSAPWASATNDIPADTVDWGADWAASWVARGYNTGGLGANANLQRGTINVDQEFDPITRPVTSRAITLETNLAELTPANLQLASGMGTLTAVAQGSGTRGNNDLMIGSDISDQYYSWGYDIKQPDGEAFRFVVFKGLATGSPNIKVTPDAPAAVALQVTALPDSSWSPTRIMRVRDVLPALP